jgi:hypothetical protein
VTDPSSDRSSEPAPEDDTAAESRDEAAPEPRDEAAPEPRDEAWIAPPESVPPISAEDLVDGEEPEDGLQERRYPSTIGGAFYICVLLVTLAGLVVVAMGDWRAGVRIMGGALIAASVARVLLSPRDAGMLAVRHKALDTAMLAGLGAALMFLVTSIPDQPGL